MNFDQRTVTCGQLRAADAGKTVVLNGWVHRDRNHGALHFINLRDRYGITQVVVDDDASPELQKTVSELRMEFCIAVTGLVRLRPQNMINADMATGEIEVKAEKIEILSRCATLPFMIDGDQAPNARQKYEDYFNKFFKDSGNFKKYVDEVDKDLRNSFQGAGTQTWGIVVQIDRNALKKRMQKDKIIE